MSARFWDRAAARYARMQLRDPDAYAAKLERSRAYLPADAEVLEMGCGTGTTAIAHAPHVADILATDFSEAMLDIARDRAAAAGCANVTFARHPVADLPTLDRRFDAVLALSLLHLLPDPAEGLRAARACLKPGGHLIANTFFLSDMGRLPRMLVWMAGRVGLLPRITPMRQAEFEAMLPREGFELRETWQPKPGAPVFHVAQAI